MEIFLHVTMIVLPILFCASLGMVARAKKLITPEQNA